MTDEQFAEGMRRLTAELGMFKLEDEHEAKRTLGTLMPDSALKLLSDLSEGEVQPWELNSFKRKMQHSFEAHYAAADPEVLARPMVKMVAHQGFCDLMDGFLSLLTRFHVSRADRAPHACRVRHLINAIIDKHPDSRPQILGAICDGWKQFQDDYCNSAAHLRAVKGIEDDPPYIVLSQLMELIQKRAERGYKMFLGVLAEILAAADYPVSTKKQYLGARLKTVRDVICEHYPGYEDLFPEWVRGWRNAVAHTDFEVDPETLELRLGAGPSSIGEQHDPEMVIGRHEWLEELVGMDPQVMIALQALMFEHALPLFRSRLPEMRRALDEWRPRAEAALAANNTRLLLKMKTGGAS